MSHPPIIRLATRGSALALWQTNRIADRIRSHFPSLRIENVVVSTQPDRDQKLSISQMGGDKGLFVKELEVALLDGRADAAVHSLKDIPVEDVTPGTCLVAYPERANPRDVLVSRTGATLQQLPPGAVVATSAPRRKAQVLYYRPDLQVCDIRGNVDTRLRKLEEGQFDAIIMAAAGLQRLGLAGRISQEFAIHELVPAPGQGIIAVQTTGAPDFNEIWTNINCAKTRLQAEAERHFSRAIGATCHSAAGCYVDIESPQPRIHIGIYSPDGKHRYYREQHSGSGGVLATLEEMVAEFRRNYPAGLP